MKIVRLKNNTFMRNIIIILLPLSIVFLTVINPFLPIVVIVSILSLYFFAIKYPELSFALFLIAGAYKADPRLEFLSKFLDLTVAFGFLTVLGIVYRILLKQIKVFIPSKQVLIPYFLIVLLGILSLSYTLAPIYGTDKLFRFLTITSLALFAPYFLFQKKESFIRFFWIFIVLAIGMVVDILSKGLTFGFHSAFGSNYLEVGRITGTSLIILLFFFLMISRRRLTKIIYLSLIPLLLFGMFISGGRGPVIAFFISILIIFIIVIGRNFLAMSTLIKREDMKLFGVVFFLSIIGVIIVINFSSYLTSFYRMEILLEGGGTSFLKRVELFSRAIEAIISFPTGLMGLGIGGFSVFYGGIDDRLYPHNIFLEVGSELGILGLFAIILLLYWSFSQGISNINRKTDSTYRYLGITALSLLIFMIVNASVSGDINDNRLLFTWISFIDVIRRFIK